MPKISLPRLRQIVTEEISAKIQEQVDHAGIRDVVNGASKLLAAVEAFKASATGAMISALTPQLPEIDKVLENMVSNPASYVEKKKVEPKKVSLRAVKDDKPL
jgi:hypothetical protein